MKRVQLAIAVAVLGLSATGASAAVITERVQFGPGPTDFANSTGSTTSTTAPGTLAYFDPTMGTLNSVSFQYSYQFTAQVTVVDTGSGTISGTAQSKSAAQFSADASAVSTALTQVVDAYVDPTDGTSVTIGSSTLSPIAADVRGGKLTYAGAVGTTATTSQDTYTSPTISVTSADTLNAFTRSGGGAFTPLFSTLSGVDSTATSGSQKTSLVGTGQGNLSVTFNYTAAAVPEPGSAAALAIGSISLLRGRRSQRRRPRTTPSYCGRQ